MKKLILTGLGLVAGMTLAHAQGYFAISGSGAGVTTTTNGVSAGLTPKSTTAEDYAFFVSSTAIADGPTDSGWTLVETVGDAPVIANGVALSAGAIVYSGGSQFQSNIAPGTYYVEVVGWSSTLGTSWSTVEGELQDNFLGDSGFFGYASSSTADFTVAVSSPGANAIGAAGVADGALVLNQVPVPEPATLALAGLGGLSMLFLRRRKS